MTNKPARLLDVVKGRSSQALQSWLNRKSQKTSGVCHRRF
ncbi:hypothetical protein I6J21_10795 [Corynebacterium glucuronolyticum]|nr:hypothetical protein I6J21_10795 [Corynebacterium glucuronolyticum]